MRHQRGETAVGRRHSGESTGCAVGILRVPLCRLAVAVDKTQGGDDLRLVPHLAEYRAALTMRDHHRHTATGHAAKKQRRIFWHFNHHQPRLELLRAVFHKFRPVIRAGNQFGQISHHLAAVANAQRKTVAACKKCTEVVARALVEQDRFSPALATTKHVAIRKSAAGGKTLEGGERTAAGDDVAHVHIDGIKAGTIKGRRHFNLAVNALLAQNRKLRSRSHANKGRGDVISRVVGKLRVQPRIEHIEHAVVFFLGALRIVAQALHAPGSF